MRALWEVSRKQIKMKSNPLQIIATAQKNQKKENAQDIISMSIFSCGAGSIEKIYDKRFGFTIGYTTGSKSKMKIMKSYENIKKEAGPKKQKKENAQDTISKSLQKNINESCLKASPTNHSGGVQVAIN